MNNPCWVLLAQWVRALAPQAEGWVFESQSWQTQIVRTSSDSPTAKRSAIGVSDHYHHAIGLSKGSGRPEVSYQFTLTLGYVLIKSLLPISKLHTFSKKFSNLKVNRWWYSFNTINFIVGDNRLDNYATLHFISFLIWFMPSVIVILNTFWSRNKEGKHTFNQQKIRPSISERNNSMDVVQRYTCGKKICPKTSIYIRCSFRYWSGTLQNAILPFMLALKTQIDLESEKTPEEKPICVS